MRPPRIGSTCTGYGGLDTAVQAVLGGEVAWVADPDPDVSRVLAARLAGVPNLGDISMVDWARVAPVDILCGGFPCQDVSQAGLRAGLRPGNRSGVWLHMVRAISVLRPRLVVIENVLGLLTARGDEPTEEHLAAEAKRDALAHLLSRAHELTRVAQARGDTDRARNCRAVAARVMGAHKRQVARCQWHERRLVRAVGTVLGTLASLGFDAEWAVLAAGDAGAPHQRKRVFLLAWPAADAGGGELQRRGVAGVLGGAPAGEPGEGDQRERAGDAAGGRGAGAPEDADCAARGERRQPAPGQAEGGGPRPDAGGPGGAHTPADPDSAGEGGRERADRAHEGRPAEDERGRGPSGGGGAAADADIERVGPHRGAAHGDAPGDGTPHAEPARGGRAASPDPAGDGRQRGAEGDSGGADAPGEGPRAEAPGHGPGAAADAERGGRDGRPQDPERGPERRATARRDSDAPADSLGDGLPRGTERDGEANGPGVGASRRVDPVGRVLDWGPYAPAVRRWEAVLGRPAPRPTEPGKTGERLSPRFVEWMMGLPEGWVTGVPGLSRNAQLKILGNGVVPHQAALALGLLLSRAGLPGGDGEPCRLAA